MWSCSPRSVGLADDRGAYHLHAIGRQARSISKARARGAESSQRERLPQPAPVGRSRKWRRVRASTSLGAWEAIGARAVCVVGSGQIVVPQRETQGFRAFGPSVDRSGARGRRRQAAFWAAVGRCVGGSRRAGGVCVRVSRVSRVAHPGRGWAVRGIALVTRAASEMRATEEECN